MKPSGRIVSQIDHLPWEDDVDGLISWMEDVDEMDFRSMWAGMVIEHVILSEDHRGLGHSLSRLLRVVRDRYEKPKKVEYELTEDDLYYFSIMDKMHTSGQRVTQRALGDRVNKPRSTRWRYVSRWKKMRGVA
jgi:hypothetical protein